MKLAFAVLAALFWAGSTFAAVPGDGPLHVPSPDWRDQVLYFLMIDRFANGDRGNDDQRDGHQALSVGCGDPTTSSRSSSTASTVTCAPGTSGAPSAERARQSSPT